MSERSKRARKSARPGRRRLRRTTLVLLFVLGTGGLTAGALTIGRDRFERILETRASASLVEVPGGPTISVQVSGRRAMLGGTMADARAHLAAVQAVRRVAGIEAVDDRIVVTTTAPKPTTAATEPTAADQELDLGTLRARIEDGRVIVSGGISDAAQHDRLMRKLNKKYPGAVSDETRLASGTPVELIVPFGNMVAAASPSITSGSIVVSAGAVVLLGTARTAADRDALVARAGRLASWRVVDALTSAQPDVRGPDARRGPDRADTAFVVPSEPEVGVDPQLDAAQGRLDDLLSTTPIEFDPRSGQLTVLSGLVLEEVVNALEGVTLSEVEVVVRPDATNGDVDAAQRIARRRATQIIAALVARGLAGVAWTPVGLRPEPVAVPSGEPPPATVAAFGPVANTVPAVRIVVKRTLAPADDSTANSVPVPVPGADSLPVPNSPTTLRSV